MKVVPTSFISPSEVDTVALPSDQERLSRARASEATVGPLDARTDSSTMSRSTQISASLAEPSWMRAGALVWALVAGLLVVRVVYAELWLARRLRRERAVSRGRLVRLLGVCRKGLNLRSNVRLIETDLVDRPAVSGIWCKSILLPVGFAERYSDAELHHIFLHELAHLKRRDVEVQMLVHFLHAIHWFNPVLWWAFGRMRLDREIAADELALSVGVGDGKSYGEAILRVLQEMQTSTFDPRTVGIAEDKAQIGARLRSIVNFGRNRLWRGAGPLAIMAITSVALTDEIERDANAENANDEVRGLAVRTLAFDGEQAVEPLLTALNDPSHRVRCEAAWSLGELGPIASKASGTIREMLNDLNLIGSTQKDSNSLLRTSEQERFRLALAKALVRVAPGDEATAVAILYWLEKSERPPVSDLIRGLVPVDRAMGEGAQRLMARLVLEASPPISFQLIRKLTEFEEHEIRSRHLSSGIWGGPVVAAVANKLESADPAFRVAAAKFFVQHPVTSGQLLERVTARLFDAHPQVPLEVLRCFGQWGSRIEGDVVPELIRLWERYGAMSLLEARPDTGKGIGPIDSADAAKFAIDQLTFAGRPIPKEALVKAQERLSELARMNYSQQIGIRRAIIRVFGVIGSQAVKAIPLLEHRCSERAAPERWDAAIALWKVGKRLDVFLGVLRDEVIGYSSIEFDRRRETLMSESIDILTEIGEPALPDLLKVFDVTSNQLRFKALLAIENLPVDDSTYHNLLEKASADSYVPIRMRALKTLRNKRSQDK